MGSDAQRAKLYTVMAEKLGQEAADSMMTLLPPWDHTEVALKADVERLGDTLNTKIDAVEASLNAKIDRLEVSIGAKMDQQFARLLMWTIGVMLAFGGLFVAAAQVA